MRMTVNEVSKFDRKSYFYPDLPAGFQITQLFHPIAEHGEVKTMVEGVEKTFRIHRMHIENDAGKLVHAGSSTLLDYNRAGSPLMEIVTEPDFRSKADVIAYLEELQKIMRWCGASDADMEKGQLRCDVNISIRPEGSNELNNRVELKNLNSFSAIGRAIDNEFARQIEIVESGGRITQETRGWDDEHGESRSQRSKEDAMDYRYFPEPDLPPLVVSKEYVLDRAVRELPMDRRRKYLNEFGLAEDDARILSNERTLSDYYEELVALTGDAKKSCSYVTTVLFAIVSEHNARVRFEEAKSFLSVPARELARVIELVAKDELSSTNSKAVVEELFENGGSTDEIVDRLGLRQVNDSGALEAVVEQVIIEFASQVAEYQAGKVQLFGFLVGSCMKASKGQGNPKMFTEMLKKRLG
jgi:aspartyl-tRNA(Asn)/glutamyl-tRNA(Gln) amidotransferase subunit B